MKSLDLNLSNGTITDDGALYRYSAILYSYAPSPIFGRLLASFYLFKMNSSETFSLHETRKELRLEEIAEALDKAYKAGHFDTILHVHGAREPRKTLTAMAKNHHIPFI
jgi:hypothetical protein